MLLSVARRLSLPRPALTTRSVWSQSRPMQVRQVYADGGVEEHIMRPLEMVSKFKILPRDFSVETDELTPTLKLKRSVAREDQFNSEFGWILSNWLTQISV